MTTLHLMSKTYAPTLKEVPAEAELASHKLLLRAGMIRKAAAGIYTYLPLGMRVLRKVEAIVREEEERIGSQELLLPFVQPAELWEESGRWDLYGPELARLTDRHHRNFCLGPTHEEITTALIRADVRSYRELPFSVFQIATKFRDEIRPRFGLLRGREFIMKDAYSFHATPDSLHEHYLDQSEAYGRMCERMGLTYVPVEADSGQIGGKVTTEFMALADAGEAELVHCACGYAADTEVAAAAIDRTPVATEPTELVKTATPGTATVADVAAFFGVSESAIVKTMVGFAGDGTLVFALLPGNRELNQVKADNRFKGFTLLTDEQFEELGLPKGFLGPRGVPAGVRVVADESLRAERSFYIGANEVGFHYAGAAPERDFVIDEFVDLIVARAGDRCPQCGAPLKLSRGIEVSQVFELGTHYSESMHAVFLDEDGVEKPFYMGCYGVGVSRSVAAIIEQHNDEHGIAWPVSVAPLEVAVLPLAKVGDAPYEKAAEVAAMLNDAGLEVIFDDRNERPGVKFADADLIGWPVQVVVGRKGYEQGIAEVKIRATGEKTEVPFAEVVEFVSTYVRANRA